MGEHRPRLARPRHPTLYSPPCRTSPPLPGGKPKNPPPAEPPPHPARPHHQPPPPCNTRPQPYRSSSSPPRSPPYPGVDLTRLNPPPAEPAARGTPHPRNPATVHTRSCLHAPPSPSPGARHLRPALIALCNEYTMQSLHSAITTPPALETTTERGQDVPPVAAPRFLLLTRG